MKLIEWFGPVIDKKKSAYYEWAYAKAALEDHSNELTYKVYEKMFGTKPKKNTPYWLVRLAIYYNSLALGFKRLGRKMNSIDEKMLCAVNKLNENELRNNAVLWHYMYLHDVEPAEFGGRELVD